MFFKLSYRNSIFKTWNKTENTDDSHGYFVWITTWYLVIYNPNMKLFIVNFNSQFDF